MSPYEIVALCLALCAIAALLPVLIAIKGAKPKSRTGDPYLDHLYKIGAVSEANTIIDEDSRYIEDPCGEQPMQIVRGTFHDAELIPGKTVQGSIMSGPSPYHKGRFVRKNRTSSERAPRAITISARQLRHINFERRRLRKPMLNRHGFQAAVSHAWDQPVRAPTSLDAWTHYLILYMCMTGAHQADIAGMSGDVPLYIDPTAPYHGQGCYGGPEVNNVIGALCGRDETGNYVSPSDLNLWSSYVPPDPVTNVPDYSTTGVQDMAPQSYSAPDPAPSYSAPDTTTTFDPGTSTI